MAEQEKVNNGHEFWCHFPYEDCTCNGGPIDSEEDIDEDY
jgi:hypothetical protein